MVSVTVLQALLLHQSSANFVAWWGNSCLGFVDTNPSCRALSQVPPACFSLPRCCGSLKRSTF